MRRIVNDATGGFMAVRACQSLLIQDTFLMRTYLATDTICVTDDTEGRATSRLKEYINLMSVGCDQRNHPYFACPEGNVEVQNLSATVSWYYSLWDSFNVVKRDDGFHILG